MSRSAPEELAANGPIRATNCGTLELKHKHNNIQVD